MEPPVSLDRQDIRDEKVRSYNPFNIGNRHYCARWKLEGAAFDT